MVKDPEILELVEMEVRELLSKYEYDGAKAHFVMGSALAASNDGDAQLGEKKILELLKIMDTTIAIPERAVDKNLLMSIEGTYQIAGRGTVATGTVDQGKIKPGDDIEIVGYTPKNLKTTVTGIETFKKTLDYGEAGDNIGLLLRGLNRDQIRRGQVIAKPGTLSAHKNLEVNLYILKEDEGGR